MHMKSYESKKVKTTNNLEQQEYIGKDACGGLYAPKKHGQLGTYDGSTKPGYKQGLQSYLLL